jgi:hypothetical protein
VGAHSVSVTSSVDALFNVGVTANGTCVLSFLNVKSMNVSVSGAPATVCLQVVSPTKKPQSYLLTGK